MANISADQIAAYGRPGMGGGIDGMDWMQALGLDRLGPGAVTMNPDGSASYDDKWLSGNYNESMLQTLAPGLMMGALPFIAGGLGGAFSGLGEGAGLGAGGAMDMGVGTQGWMDYLGSQAAGGAAGGAGGLQQVLQQLQQIPGGSQIAQQLVSQLMGGGGGGGSGMAQGGGGFNAGSLLPLLGIGSGLNTMFNRSNAVDPAMINSLWQAGQRTYNTSLDPQNALHDRTQQQVVDASRAAQSARGIGMSPYGAAAEGKNVSDFNIDWQNQALQRQMQGTQSFAGAGNTAANAGVANNAQAFLQNQTGLNNLTTGLGGLFGSPGANPAGGGGANPIGSWINSLFTGGGGGGAGGGSTPGGYNPSSAYDSSGQYVPFYTGVGAGGDPAYG